MWNYKKLGLVAVIFIIVVFAFGSCVKSCSNSEEPPQTETISANDSSASEAEESQPPADNISINDMQATIDDLNKQIAEKDAQIQALQNSGADGPENGGVTFQEFLNLYFWPDGNTYRLSDDRKLYSNYACTSEYELNPADYTFPCNRSLAIDMESGLSVSMLLTTNGQIVWCPSPYLILIDG